MKPCVSRYPGKSRDPATRLVPERNGRRLSPLKHPTYLIGFLFLLERSNVGRAKALLRFEIASSRDDANLVELYLQQPFGIAGQQLLFVLDADR